MGGTDILVCLRRKTDGNVCPTGFTLIELLVVIGIIVIIASIAIPMSMKAYRAADRTRTQGDLNSIAVVLEEFKASWGDYPRPDSAGSNCGFAALGRYLIGPGGVYTGGPTPTIPSAPPYNPSRNPVYGPGDVAAVASNEYVCINPGTPASGPPGPDWVPFSYSDGHTGPGLKKPIGGKVLGPYISADKFKMQGLAMLDHHGRLILYFPGSPAKPNIHAADGYASASKFAAYNVNDGEIFFRTNGEATGATSTGVIQMMLGDTNRNGMIDSGETEATTAPFILWSAGADGIFGPIRSASSYPSQQDILKCDDVIR